MTEATFACKLRAFYPQVHANKKKKEKNLRLPWSMGNQFFRR